MIGDDDGFENYHNDRKLFYFRTLLTFGLSDFLKTTRYQQNYKNPHW